MRGPPRWPTLFLKDLYRLLRPIGRVHTQLSAKRWRRNGIDHETNSEN